MERHDLRRIMALAVAVAALAWAANAQTHHGAARRAEESAGRRDRDAALRARIIAFINRAEGWQMPDKIEVQSISPADPSGIRVARIELTKGDKHALQTYFITPDETEMILGEAAVKLSGDPWAGDREKLAVAGSPTEGPADAAVTIYEFSDLECPYCKQENQDIQQLRSAMPTQVRVVFKYFPLTSIHPWAMDAAKAAACVAHHNAADFWPFSQAVFDHQDELTLATAPGRMRDFAMESGVPAGDYDACMSSPLPARAVKETMAQGARVDVNSTPTMFINGRPIAGAVPAATLRMIVNNEIKYAPLYDVGEGGRSARGDDSGAALGGEIKGHQCGECAPPPPLPAHK